jgi:hypothetical protein
LHHRQPTQTLERIGTDIFLIAYPDSTAAEPKLPAFAQALALD